MNVAELRAALDGLPDDLPVEINDSDELHYCTAARTVVTRHRASWAWRDDDPDVPLGDDEYRVLVIS